MFMTNTFSRIFLWFQKGEIEREWVKSFLFLGGATLIRGGTLIVFANFSRGYAYLGGYAY